MGNLNFDANEVEPDSGSFDPLPAGEYPVIVADSDVCDTKSDNGGKYLKLELLVIAGPFENRKLFTNLNIVNPSEKAQQIGQSQLSSLCRAVGKLQVGDSAELHDIPFTAKVSVKNDPTYGLQNEVKAFKPSGSAAPSGRPAPAATPQQQPATAASGAGKRPWEK